MARVRRVTKTLSAENAGDRALRVVRAAGGRVTSCTRTVVATLADSTDHLTAEDLIAEVESRLPGVAASTVYRVIQRLSELDLVEHVHTSVGPPIYHLHERGHAHLVCNGCGVISDISDRHLNGLTQTLTRQFEFTLEPRHSALVGYCRDCAPRRAHLAH